MNIRLMRQALARSVEPRTAGEAAGATTRRLSTCRRKVVVTKVRLGTGERPLLLQLYQKQKGMLRTTQPSPSAQRRFLILRQ
jgi:hypothetical protein